MANDYTDEEKRRLVNEWHENLEKGLPVTKEHAERMKNAADSTGEAKKRIDDMNAAFGKLGKGAKDWTKAMYDGQQGMSAMNGSVDMVAGALEMFISLIPGMRLLKIVLTLTVGAIAAYAKAANEQADALFKTYQDLNKNGMATAGGMTDIYNNMQKFNYGIKELGDMTALLKENSEALASFGGTAASGTQAFANAANQIQHSNIGETFQKMGKTPDEINRGIALFIKSQQSIGVKSADINKNLAAEASRYVMQLDLMSKLTGQTAEQLQAKLDTANSEAAFNQVQYELQQKADAGDEKARKQIEENKKLAEMYAGTEFGKELFRGVGGDISAMTKTMMTAPEVVALIQKGDYTAAQISNALGRGAKQFRSDYGNIIKMNAGDFGLPVKDLSAAVSRFGDESAEQQEAMAKAEQKHQKEALDPNTKAMVKLRIEQQKTRDSLQNFVNKGIGPATTALEAFSEVANRIAGVVPGTGSEVKPGGKETSEGTTATSSSTSMVQGQNAVTIGNEQRIGGDRNWRSNNPGNIEYGEFAKSMGAIGSDGRFAVFPTLEMGRKAADTLLKGKAYADKSAADALKQWAPGVEKGNDPAAYADMISKRTGIDMRKKYKDMTQEEQSKFLDAMTKVEGGRAGTIKQANGNQTSAETPIMATNTAEPRLQNPKVSGADGWDGMLSGPASGYRPNVTMHGTEDLKITPASNATNAGATSGMDTNTLLQQQTSKLDELIRILGDQQQNDLGDQQLNILEDLNRTLQNQVNVSTKILQASR